MTIREYLRLHPRTPLYVMFAALVLIVGAGALRSPYWWLLSCALIPVMFAAPVTWLVVRRHPR
jgi:hypothetical protein